MRKLMAIVIISVFLIVILMVLAFFYVDLSGHIKYQYKMLINGISSGTVKIDKYVTEDKIIYKSKAEYSYSLEYPEVSEKLFLKKKDRTPLKFVKESTGVKGQKRLTLFVQDEGSFNFLFLEHPEFITFKEDKPIDKAVIFSLEEIMLYMPLVAQYNFWRKGTQFFDCFIPVDEAIPPVMEKVEVRYVKDEYIPVMGCKVEAESFIIRSKVLPDIKMFLSKYTHRILVLKIKDRNIQFVLTGCIKGPVKRIEYLRKKIISIFNIGEILDRFVSKELSVPEKGSLSKETAGEEEGGSQEKIEKEEIFFESNGSLLSGKLWIPDGEGPFPAVLIVPKDGPMVKGEQYMLASFGEIFSTSGFIAFIFDNPGQGKSQGSFMGLDDEKKIKNIKAAVKYLEGHSAVKKANISLIGHDGGGYLVLKAAAALPSVNSCILLDMSLRSAKADFSRKETMKEYLKIILSDYGFKAFNEDMLESKAEKIQEYRNEIIQTTEDFSFFLGIKLPLKGYRDFLLRDSYEAVLLSDKLLLLIFGKNNIFFDAQAVNNLKKLFSEKGRFGEVSIFKNLDFYMGKMTENNGSWNFLADNSIFEFMIEWISKNAIIENEEIDEPENNEILENSELNPVGDIAR